MSKSYYVYITSNTSNSVYYTGVTNDLVRRIYEHKNKLVQGFTSKYKLHKFVYYEYIETIELAIVREKQVKDMNRQDKIKMIDKFNPTWKDL